MGEDRNHRHGQNTPDRSSILTPPVTMTCGMPDGFPADLIAGGLTEKHGPSHPRVVQQQSKHDAGRCAPLIPALPGVHVFHPRDVQNLEGVSQTVCRNTVCVCSNAKAGILERWQGLGFKGP